MMENSDPLKNSDRKRGRPTGSGRVPLSIEERRARNAQYERERRIETSEAMAELAHALGCVNTTSNAEILATAVQELQRVSSRDSSDDITELKRCNAKLMQQIEDIEKRLSSYEDRIEAKSKKDIIKHGGIKKRDKHKTGKSKSILNSVVIKQESAEIGHSCNRKETLNDIEPSPCEDTQIMKTESMELTGVEPLLLDSINECPVDWGIDHLIAGYIL